MPLDPTKPIPGSYDAIMEETWEVVENAAPRSPGLYANGRLVWEGLPGNLINRFVVAKLGKDALAFIPDLEWSGSDYDSGYDEYLAICPSCHGYRPGQTTRRKRIEFGHSPSCDLGTLCHQLQSLSKVVPPPPEEPRGPHSVWDHLDDERLVQDDEIEG